MTTLPEIAAEAQDLTEAEFDRALAALRGMARKDWQRDFWVIDDKTVTTLCLDDHGNATVVGVSASLKSSWRHEPNWGIS